MKKVFIALAVFIFAAGSFGCATNANTSANTANLNSSDSNANSTIAAVETPNANSKFELAQDVPAFTNASDALEAGKKYFENNLDEQAVNAFEQAIKLDPNLGEAHFHLGVVYELKEKNEVNPTPEPTVSGKAAKNKKPAEKPSEKEFRAAIKAYESFLKKNPKDAAAHYYLGLSYEKIFEDEKAQKALQEAVELQPEDSQYQYEYGQVLIKLAQYDQAVRALKKSLELDPENTRAEEALDRAEAGKKRVDAAKKENAANKQEEPQQQKSGRAKNSPAANKAETPADKPKETAPPPAPPAAKPNSNNF